MTESPIRICFVCTHSFTLATLYKGLFPYLRSHGYEIDVIVGDREYSDFDPKYFGEIQPQVIPMPRMPHPLRDPLALFRFYRFFRKGRFDIVHVSTPKASLLGSIAAKAAGSKVVFLQRRLVYQMMTGLKRWFYKQSDRITCAFSDLVIPVSRQIGAVLTGEGLAPARKVRMIGSGGSNGTNVRRFRPDAVPAKQLAALKQKLNIPAGAPVLVYVGRVSGEKGVDLLPALLAEVRAGHPDTILVVAGPEDARDPPLEETLRSFADDPAIRRIGFVDDPSPFYTLADLFVFPSYFEGIANVLLEAAAQERVAIGFEVPGVEETILHGVSGLLVPKGDVAAMGAVVNRLLADPSSRRSMEIAARKRVEAEFANEVIWSGIDSSFRELIGRPAEADI